MPEEWKESTNAPVYKKGDKTVCSDYRGISFCQLHSKLYPTCCCQGSLLVQRILIGITSVDFGTTGQLLILYFAFVKYLRKKMAIQ